MKYNLREIVKYCYKNSFKIVKLPCYIFVIFVTKLKT